MKMATADVIDIAAAREAAVRRVFDATAGAMDLIAMYLGDRLGYYSILASDGPVTPGQLASRTGTHERYAQEWLEQQTVTGILEVENSSDDARSRLYRLPEAWCEVLADRDSLEYMAPLAQAFMGALAPIHKIVQAYRTGGGVSFADYGADLREGQARMNRVPFLQLLGQEWIQAIPGIKEALSAPDAHVADIGCGAGWSSIGVALAFPTVEVDGFDSDAASIELARTNALEYGVSDRVRFSIADVSEFRPPSGYDLVMALECVHDMGDPVGALRTMRTVVKPGGAVLIMDERVGDRFTPQGEGLEFLMYGFSIVHCLPAGMHDGNACTGTVMRTPTLRRYADQAGFRDVVVLPIEHPMFRFYQLII
jgi:2-polyprenyl-3-methyl-5-hydroxy-6-metoxy-1,4-benzoquinol methylase